MTEHRARCQCGALTVRASADPDMVVACNCKACQHRTGAPFGVGGYFKKETLTMAGASSVWRRAAETGRWIENHFCPTCGTTLYWGLEMRPDHIGVAAGAFESQLPEPARAIWTEDQHDWMIFPDHMPTFPKATPET